MHSFTCKIPPKTLSEQITAKEEHTSQEETTMTNEEQVRRKGKAGEGDYELLNYQVENKLRFMDAMYSIGNIDNILQ